LWRYLGFEFLVNHFTRFRKFWEHYLCFVVRGKVIEFRLEAVKQDAAPPVGRGTPEKQEAVRSMGTSRH
jgi:hypothetical protein